jgi:hypothetical protein
MKLFSDRNLKGQVTGQCRDDKGSADGGGEGRGPGLSRDYNSYGVDLVPSPVAHHLTLYSPAPRFTLRASRLLLLLAMVFMGPALKAQSIKIGLLKYSGGGDWYVNPTSLPNLIKFCNETIRTDIAKDPVTVEPGSRYIFNLPFVHMTGHGNVLFSPQEAENLRQYLLAGGFLHIDDNYGLDQFARREMKKVFPELDFVELPATHDIFHKPNLFPDGLPKIHEHDGKRPQGFGLIWQGRLVCFYSYESDLGDGWEDPAVHNDSQETRLKALKMGANLMTYVFTEK